MKKYFDAYLRSYNELTSFKIKQEMIILHNIMLYLKILRGSLKSLGYNTGAKYYDLSVIITHTRPILRCYGQLLKIADF